LHPTGIEGLDEIFNGGVPTGSSVVLIGPPGAGKTVLALQWLFEGMAKYKEPGLYIGFTESTKKALDSIRQFDFFKEDLLGPDKVHFTDLRLILDQLYIAHKGPITSAQADEVIDVIRHMVDQMQAKRVVLDSLTGFLYLIDGADGKRDFIFRLSNSLSRIGVTLFMTGESYSKEQNIYSIVEYLADGIIDMSNNLGQQSMVRKLNILKMRGSNYRSGAVVFDIAKSGIVIYPKIPTYTAIAQTDFKNRKSIGVPELDKYMGGGIPQGHVVLVGGNTGSGKTTLALHFVREGAENSNEGTVYVALEESFTQVRRTAAQHGWDLEKWEKDGKMKFVRSELVDLNADKLLYDILRACEEIKAKRVVIDSISSLENATAEGKKVREFMLQILSYFKSEGITCLMTYLTPEIFGAGDKQLIGGTSSNELGLSSMVDGIILLRYVERGQRVHKLLNILKMRGSEHEKDIMEFEVNKDGFKLGSRFES
jgi:circadian clock protein KaiC